MGGLFRGIMVIGKDHGHFMWTQRLAAQIVDLRSTHKYEMHTLTECCF